jgi:hypothetical protein
MLKLVSSLGLALALADIKRRIRHWMRAGVLGAVGAVLAVIALCFFLVALHLWLSGLLSPIASAAIIGAVLLVIALILFFLASRPMAARAPAPPQPDPMASAGDTFQDAMTRFGPTAAAIARHPLFPAAAMALVAGFFLGRRSKRDRDRDAD